MSHDIDLDEEGQSFNGKKPIDRKPSSDDPISLFLLSAYYKFNRDSLKNVKIAIAFSIPVVLLLLFSLFVSNSTSNLIAFFALLLSLVFICISIWMLCWILDKDQGTR